jgi:hypothetical protein
MAKKKCPVVKGQFYAAKYKGSGGDLILGQVQSVRTSGHIVSTNLLNGKTSTKKIEVFLRRNKRISKSQANKISAAFKRGGKEEARKAAIEAPEFRNGRGSQQQLPLKSDKKVDQNLLKRLDEMAFDMMTQIRRDVELRVVRFRHDAQKLIRGSSGKETE